MALKLVVLSCILAFAYGSVVPAPLVAGDDPFIQYEYGYQVSDANTGDYKTQNEARDGDVVRGQYAFLESDGTRRVVDYYADPIRGFNAAVRNELVGAPLVGAEPVVAARIAAAPVAPVAPVPAIAPTRYAIAPAAAPVYTNYAAAVAPTRYTAAPISAVGPYTARYAVAPAATPVATVGPARYAVAPGGAPVVPTRYAAAPTFAYAAPYTAAYPSPYAAAYSTPYSTAAVTQYSSTGPLAYTQYPSAYAPVLAAYRTPVAAAPAKLIDAAPVAAAGYRYP